METNLENNLIQLFPDVKNVSEFIKYFNFYKFKIVKLIS